MSGDDNGGDKNGSKNSPGKLIASGKDLVALLRDFALFVLALLLLVFPTAFNSVLTRAGFEEGSLVGFKWKSKLVESDAALKEALATITDLKAQLDKASQALADAQASLSDPSLKEKLARVEHENKQLNASSTKVEASVTNTIASSAPLVEKAQTAVDTNTMWGVIFSGDATLDAARYEVETEAPKLGIPNASIYLDRNGSYRSVSVVDSRSQAEQVLPKAKQRRADAYIVNMSHWCPTANEKTGYRECASP